MADAKLRIDRTTAPGLTMLTLHGIVDASFEGAKVAASVKTQRVLVNLRNVQRFASWGMAEWMNFLRTAAELDLYFIECSTYAIQQMKLVTGLLGHGKLVSFLVPFRCNSCSEEFETLAVLAEDRNALANLAASEKPCTTCGGTARMARHYVEIATTISAQAELDVAEDVSSFLKSQFGYQIAPGLTRFQAFQRAQGNYTYMRFRGNIGTLPSDALAAATTGTMVLDLSGIMYTPDRLEAWHSYLKAASTRADAIQLADLPAGFFEHAVRPDELGDKLLVRTFTHVYECPRCNTATPRLIDVAEHLEELTNGVLPAARCSSCKFEVPGQSRAPIQRLPARGRDLQLDSFLSKAKSASDDKLTRVLGARAKPAAAAVTRRTVLLGSVLGAVIVAAIVVFAVFVLVKKQAPAVETQNTKPQFQRPDWILSDTPSSAYCQELIGRVMCVGVSSYSSDRDAAARVAGTAAMDELVNLIGIKVTDPWFQTNVLGVYGPTRTRMLSAMQNAGPRADDPAVSKARERVATLLLASGGAGVPAQRSDWYWEEYENGSGTEFLTFVRYDVTLDAMKSLIERYTAPTKIGGMSVVTAFPGLAWQGAEFNGGAMVVTPAAQATIPAKAVISAINNKPIVDVTALSAALQGTTAEVTLTVTSGTSQPETVPFKMP